MARKADAAQNHDDQVVGAAACCSPTSRITVCAIITHEDAENEKRREVSRGVVEEVERLAHGLFLERVDDRLPVGPGALHPVGGHGVADLLQVRLELRARAGATVMPFFASVSR